MRDPPSPHTNPYAAPRSALPVASPSAELPRPPWVLRCGLWVASRLCGVFLLSFLVILVISNDADRDASVVRLFIPMALVGLGWAGLLRDPRWWSPWPFLLLTALLLWVPAGRGDAPFIPFLVSAAFCAWAATWRLRWWYRQGRQRTSMAGSRVDVRP